MCESYEVVTFARQVEQMLDIMTDDESTQV